MERRFRSLESEMSQLKGEVVLLRKDLKVVQAKNQNLENEVSSLRKENSSLWNEIYRLKGPRLLIDIIALIIEELRHDRPTLKICALVCRDWLHFSRSHLFRSIWHSAAFWCRPVDYLAILQNPNCTIFPHVRTINIIGNTDDGSADPPFLGLHWLDRFLGHVNKFTSLSTIELASLDLWELDQIRTSLKGVRQQITRIDIVHVTFQSMQDFTALVADFPRLRTLSVGDYQFSSQDDLQPTYILKSHPIPPPASLRRLCIGNCNDDIPGRVPFDSSVLRWLFDVKYINLQAMQINVSSRNPSAVDALARYVTFLGSSLVYLQIITWSEEYAVALATPIAVNTGLRHVDICSWCSDGHAVRNFQGKSLHLPVGWIPTLSILPPSVESIILEMRVDSGNVSYAGAKKGLSAFDWTPVDKLLSGDRFPALKVLIIWSEEEEYRPRDISKYIQQLWPQLLPLCVAKQILTSIVTPRMDRPSNTFR